MLAPKTSRRSRYTGKRKGEKKAASADLAQAAPALIEDPIDDMTLGMQGALAEVEAGNKVLALST
jgi:hypothetical protein